jgi:archaellum component FlaC
LDEGESDRDDRRRVTEEVTRAQRLIDSLRQDVAEYRRQNQVLTRERNRLSRSAAMLDASRIEVREAQSRWQESDSEKNRLRELAAELDEENANLSRRCETLESELQQERDSHRVSRLELRCLRDQVQELEQIVALLQEHIDAAAE